MCGMKCTATDICYGEQVPMTTQQYPLTISPKKERRGQDEWWNCWMPTLVSQTEGVLWPQCRRHSRSRLSVSSPPPPHHTWRGSELHLHHTWMLCQAV